GVAAKEALSVLSAKLGALDSTNRPPAVVKPATGEVTVTWDLEARHLLLSWPVTGPATGEHAALMTAANWLNMRLFGDAELKRMSGMVLAGVDLDTPEGPWFYVSASLKPDASFEAVRQRIKVQLKTLRTDEGELSTTPLLGQQLAFGLMRVRDPRIAKANAPGGMTDAMIEGNLGLQWAMGVHRYGIQRDQLAERLRSISAAEVRRAAQQLLSEDRVVTCIIRPGDPPAPR
ncbi:MAG TPA: hypothetical protein DCY13_18935, partial [Verrucomicrobiales bacterium]|nr:hypothetical protein [Verrucomicrobiales bacterium]